MGFYILYKSWVKTMKLAGEFHSLSERDYELFFFQKFTCLKNQKKGDILYNCFGIKCEQFSSTLQTSSRKF
jgi:hypothetical protein